MLGQRAERVVQSYENGARAGVGSVQCPPNYMRCDAIAVWVCVVEQREGGWGDEKREERKGQKHPSTKKKTEGNNALWGKSPKKNASERRCAVLPCAGWQPITSLLWNLSDEHV